MNTHIKQNQKHQTQEEICIYRYIEYLEGFFGGSVEHGFSSNKEEPAVVVGFYDADNDVEYLSFSTLQEAEDFLCNVVMIVRNMRGL